MARQRALFVCTKNSTRSQMAEGRVHHFAGDCFDVASAGIERTSVHPMAIRVMAEIGIDISHHTSKTLDAGLGQPWDYAITVCDLARERCRTFPERTRRLHWAVADPALASGTEEQQLDAFRWARDELRQWMQEWFAEEQRSRSERGKRRPQAAGFALLACVVLGIAWWTLGPMAGAIVALMAVMSVLGWWVWSHRPAAVTIRSYDGHLHATATV